MILQKVEIKKKKQLQIIIMMMTQLLILMEVVLDEVKRLKYQRKILIQRKIQMYNIFIFIMCVFYEKMNMFLSFTASCFLLR
jgi:hypothetical protein